jgi:hypothetical protein
MTDCLHCKISMLVIEHFRMAQGLAANVYPHLGNDEVPNMLTHLAQVVADVITPCEDGKPQLLRRVGLFASKVVQLAEPSINKSPHEGSLLH